MAVKTSAEIWAEVIDTVERSLGGNAVIWLRQTKAESFSNGVLSVTVQNAFTKKYIEEEYLKQIRSALKSITSADTEVNFIISFETPTTEETDLKKKDTFVAGSVDPDSSLNPKYTFDNFVVGPSNRFSYNAALAVAESKVYNPLYIYGGVGLGKTHLMHAIGNSIKDTNPNLKVLYMSSETFTNEMINALRRAMPMQEFRNKYRTVDVLLIDDIQFMRGKDGSQEEFFHTFNTLHSSQKQIILTSDSHPRDILALEERLRSRFEWGLITVIEPPELETRIAILKKKSEELGIDELPDDVAMFIADRVTSNIRELEGCLIRGLALADLDDVPLSIDIVREALKDIMPKGSDGYKELITAESIKKIVAKHFNVRMVDLKSDKRTKPLTLPRHIAMYLCRRLTKLSLIDIGRDFGKKDHTTVMYACDKIEEAIQNDPTFEGTINQLIKEIKDQNKA
ncbi:MAG: chromosomal replication initiator protein [Candidatus Poribacteria bacterium]|nr:chromosomal replication initiator protein [Candidatus Poribacteria bacterium]